MISTPCPQKSRFLNNNPRIGQHILIFPHNLTIDSYGSFIAGKKTTNRFKQNSLSRTIMSNKSINFATLTGKRNIPQNFVIFKTFTYMRYFDRIILSVHIFSSVQVIIIKIQSSLLNKNSTLFTRHIINMLNIKIPIHNAHTI